MQLPDLINAGFEGFGGCFVWLSVYRLWLDKRVAGIDTRTMLFWLSWGFWNLFYYRDLHQMFSWVAGMNIVLANTVWCSQMWYYKHVYRNRATLDSAA